MCLVQIRDEVAALRSSLDRSSQSHIPEVSPQQTQAAHPNHQASSPAVTGNDALSDLDPPASHDVSFVSVEELIPGIPQPLALN